MAAPPDRPTQVEAPGEPQRGRLSQGRVIVGVGAGYVEFEAMGIDLAARGVRMDEHFDAMRALWAMLQPRYSGRVVRFDRAVTEQCEALGVDRLVFFPRLEAPAGHRHDPVPVDDILRTIDALAATMASGASSRWFTVPAAIWQER